MFGDVGVPKSAADQAANRFPSGGYSTEFSTRQPNPPGLNPGQGWVNAPPPPKQAACRHNRRATFSLFDGHSESWKWEDLVTDKDDRIRSEEPKVGNGRIWLQIKMMSLPLIPIEIINAVAHDSRLR